MKIASVLATLLLSTTLVACEESKKSSSAGGGASGLGGTWVTPCSANGQQSLRAKLSISGSSINRSIEEYLDSNNCNQTGLMRSFNTLGTVTVTGESTPADGGPLRHANVNYTRGTITTNEATRRALAAEGTSLQDAMRTAGYNDINNVPLSNLTDNPNLFTVYRIDNGALRLGNDDNAGNNGTSAATRHKQLHGTTVFNRQ